MTPFHLSQVLLCRACGNRLHFDDAGARQCCPGPEGPAADAGIVRYEPDQAADAAPEMRVRDRQAAGYLQHGKFPTQIARIRSFVEGLPSQPRSLPVLDLGCGPGPTAGILTAAGFSIAGIDFSFESLRINAQQCAGRAALFIQADLRRVRFAPNSVAGLMMADFLQHLVEPDVQRAFLHEAFSALAPGGWFFLSFFNLNFKNRLKGDVRGSFSGSAIPYRRMTPGEVAAMLPQDVAVERRLPMNIVHGADADRRLASLPFAFQAARMAVLCGRKRG